MQGWNSGQQIQTSMPCVPKRKKQLKKNNERGSTSRTCCKLYETPVDYLQQNNFKTCLGCRDYERLHTKDENTPPQPTEQEQ